MASQSLHWFQNQTHPPAVGECDNVSVFVIICESVNVKLVLALVSETNHQKSNSKMFRCSSTRTANQNINPRGLKVQPSPHLQEKAKENKLREYKFLSERHRDQHHPIWACLQQTTTPLLCHLVVITLSNCQSKDVMVVFFLHCRMQLPFLQTSSFEKQHNSEREMV